MAKRFLLIIFVLCVGVVYSYGQNTNKDTLNRSQFDSLAVAMPAVLDSSVIGHSIFDLLSSDSQYNGGSVMINQPNYMSNALYYYKLGNNTKKRNGFRIRLFFDNRQTARGESEEVVNTFKESFSHIPVYRSYTNPYFKVVVGNYRTKSDAIKTLQEIKRVFPNAIVVKENIDYPAI